MLISLVAYYVYHVVDNYFYLQKNFFNTSIKYTGTNTLSTKVIVKNTMNATSDTLDPSNSNLILVFCATWCKPCLEEIPFIKKLYRNQKCYGYKLYFIFEEENHVINNFSKRNRLIFETYTIISGKPAQEQFSIYPTTIVCSNGKSDLKIEGQLSEADTAIIYKKFTDQEGVR